MPRGGGSRTALHLQGQSQERTPPAGNAQCLLCIGYPFAVLQQHCGRPVTAYDSMSCALSGVCSYGKR